LTSEDLQRLRDRASPDLINRNLSARTLKIACKANKAVDSNFLLVGDRCCFCGVGRLDHKVAA